MAVKKIYICDICGIEESPDIKHRYGTYIYNLKITNKVGTGHSNVGTIEELTVDLCHRCQIEIWNLIKENFPETKKLAKKAFTGYSDV